MPRIMSNEAIEMPTQPSKGAFPGKDREARMADIGLGGFTPPLTGSTEPGPAARSAEQSAGCGAVDHMGNRATQAASPTRNSDA